MNGGRVRGGENEGGGINWKGNIFCWVAIVP